MLYRGTLQKMQTEFSNPINYYLVFDSDFLQLNSQLGKKLSIKAVGYQCLNCGKAKRIFRQGFCYDCFVAAPSAGDWIMRPELSKAHLGIADRDLAYEQKVQLQPHVVYLAASSSVKVGVTRKSQVPTRWIDQGASAAMSLIEVPNRYLAGICEVALKTAFSDKTNWRKMLQNDVADISLPDFAAQALSLIPTEAKAFINNASPEVTHLHYPVLKYPEKLQSQSLEKTPQIEGVLTGIKGQYLLFENGDVFNVRSNEGYVVEIEI